MRTLRPQLASLLLLGKCPSQAGKGGTGHRVRRWGWTGWEPRWAQRLAGRAGGSPLVSAERPSPGVVTARAAPAVGGRSGGINPTVNMYIYEIYQGLISSRGFPVAIPRRAPGSGRGVGAEGTRSSSSGSGRAPAATWERRAAVQGLLLGSEVSRRGAVRIGSYTAVC